MKNPVTRKEYDILLSSFRKLEKRQEVLRQAHIDANSEGDQRECDAWSVTDRLSKQNYQKMKEISDFLQNVRIVEQINEEKIQEGSVFKMSMNGEIKEYFFCYPFTLQFIGNGISGLSIVGERVRGKKKGFRDCIVLDDGKSLEVEVLEVVNS